MRKKTRVMSEVRVEDDDTHREKGSMEVTKKNNQEERTWVRRCNEREQEKTRKENGVR